jgi:hypothetical protein
LLRGHGAIDAVAVLDPEEADELELGMDPDPFITD